jgi:hypothetical protein
MNCLFRDQHIVGTWDLLIGDTADSCGRAAKSCGYGVTPISMPVVVLAAQTTHTTHVHKGRSIINR